MWTNAQLLKGKKLWSFELSAFTLKLQPKRKALFSDRQGSLELNALSFIIQELKVPQALYHKWQAKQGLWGGKYTWGTVASTASFKLGGKARAGPEDVIVCHSDSDNARDPVLGLSRLNVLKYLSTIHYLSRPRLPTGPAMSVARDVSSPDTNLLLPN